MTLWSLGQFPTLFSPWKSDARPPERAWTWLTLTKIQMVKRKMRRSKSEAQGLPEISLSFSLRRSSFLMDFFTIFDVLVDVVFLPMEVDWLIDFMISFFFFVLFSFFFDHFFFSFSLLWGSGLTSLPRQQTWGFELASSWVPSLILDLNPFRPLLSSPLPLGLTSNSDSLWPLIKLFFSRGNGEQGFEGGWSNRFQHQTVVLSGVCQSSCFEVCLLRDSFRFSLPAFKFSISPGFLSRANFGFYFFDF